MIRLNRPLDSLYNKSNKTTKQNHFYSDCLHATKSVIRNSIFSIVCKGPVVHAVKKLAVCVQGHNSDFIMGAMASQFTSLIIVYSNVYSGADRRKHQSSSSLAFVQGIHRWPGKFPAQMDSYAENVFIWWRHHEHGFSCVKGPGGRSSDWNLISYQTKAELNCLQISLVLEASQWDHARGITRVKRGKAATCNSALTSNKPIRLRRGAYICICSVFFVKKTTKISKMLCIFSVSVSLIRRSHAYFYRQREYTRASQKTKAPFETWK